MSTQKGFADLLVDNMAQVPKPYALLPPNVIQAIIPGFTYPVARAIYQPDPQSDLQYWYQEIDVYIPSSEWAPGNAIIIFLGGQYDAMDGIIEGLSITVIPTLGFSLEHITIDMATGVPTIINQNTFGVPIWNHLDAWAKIRAWFEPGVGIMIDASDGAPGGVAGWPIGNEVLGRIGQCGIFIQGLGTAVEQPMADNWIVDDG